MDELIDILDEEGSPTGITALKSEAHKKGLFHPTVHVWFYTRDGKVLLQQRGRKKKTHPLLWDVSVAGHIGAGENPEVAAVRETSEEIGYLIMLADLKKIGVFKSTFEHSAHFRDNEFHHTYMYELKLPLEKLVKQESEVEDLKLISLIQFSEETWGKANLGKYVPHDADYYKTVIKAIKSKL